MPPRAFLGKDGRRALERVAELIERRRDRAVVGDDLRLGDRAQHVVALVRRERREPVSQAIGSV